MQGCSISKSIIAFLEKKILLISQVAHYFLSEIFHVSVFASYDSRLDEKSLPTKLGALSCTPLMRLLIVLQ